LLRSGARHAEVDDFGSGPAIDLFDEDVGGFEVAMDDGLVVGVLDAIADADEELEAFADGEFVEIAVIGDGDTVDLFDHEVWTALWCGARVEDFGDGGMLHQGEGLPFGLETGNDFASVHADFDELHGDTAIDGHLLLRAPDLAHAAFADEVQHLVAAHSATFEDSPGGTDASSGLFDEAVDATVRGDELFHLTPDEGILRSKATQAEGARAASESDDGFKETANFTESFAGGRI